MSEAPAPTDAAISSPRPGAGRQPPHRWRRAMVRIAIAAAVVGLLWWAGVWGGKAAARRAFAVRRPEQAVGWLQFVHVMAPWDAEAEFLRARLARREGRLDDVRRHLQRAQTLGHPAAAIQREEWLAMAQSGRLRESERPLSDLLISQPEDVREVCEALANGYLLNVRFHDAEALLVPWVGDFPDDPLPWLIRGSISLQQNRYAEAEGHLRKTLELDPGNSLAALRLGTTLMQQHRYEEALPVFRQVTGSRERNRALVGEAQCLRVLGRVDEAREALQRIPPDDEVYADALVDLGRIELSQQRYEQAAAAFETALKVRPKFVQAQQPLAASLQALGRTEEALRHRDAARAAQAAQIQIDDLREALMRGSDTIDMRYRIGRACLECGQSEAGTTWLHSALDRDPGHLPSLAALAGHYAALAEHNPRFQALADEYRTRHAAARAADESKSRATGPSQSAAGR